jgi:leucyl-tRNA synthetase
MFMGAFDQPIPWNEQGTRGCRRFLDRVWALQDMVNGTGDTDADMKKKVHATIKKVGEDYERMKFNTAIAAMMALTNDFYAKGTLTKDELHTLVLLLAPVAPHISEEISEALGFASVHNAPWPVYEESALVEDAVEYGVQVNGKVRGRITLPVSMDIKQVEAAALACEDVAPHLEGKTVRKVIVVKNIVNIVVG